MTAWIITALLIIFLAFFLDALHAEYQEWRQWRNSAKRTPADDEWLARQDIAPLSSTVDRVRAAK